MNVYLLEHEASELDKYGEIPRDVETKILGVYSSRQRAVEAIERFKVLPGFRDYPDSFYIGKCKVNVDHWAEGFISV